MDGKRTMNTQDWIAKITTNDGDLRYWLERQYIGEISAATRISALVESTPEAHKATMKRIALDEKKHAEWVAELLLARGMELPVVKHAEERYWKPVLSFANSFAKLAAAGHHAEGMRLVRIRALANCEKVDADIRDVFSRILPDEEFHERAFRLMSTPLAIEEMKPHHSAGLEMLGLEV